MQGDVVVAEKLHLNVFLFANDKWQQVVAFPNKV